MLAHSSHHSMGFSQALVETLSRLLRLMLVIPPSPIIKLSLWETLVFIQMELSWSSHLLCADHNLRPLIPLYRLGQEAVQCTTHLRLKRMRRHST